MAANIPSNADTTTPPKSKQPDYLILGVGTGEVGQMRGHWDAVWDKMEQTDFTGKQVAIAGLDNQVGHPYSKKDAVGVLTDKVRERGGRIVPKNNSDQTAQ